MALFIDVRSGFGCVLWVNDIRKVPQGEAERKWGEIIPIDFETYLKIYAMQSQRFLINFNSQRAIVCLNIYIFGIVGDRATKFETNMPYHCKFILEYCLSTLRSYKSSKMHCESKFSARTFIFDQLLSKEDI